MLFLSRNQPNLVFKSKDQQFNVSYKANKSFVTTRASNAIDTQVQLDKHLSERTETNACLERQTLS